MWVVHKASRNLTSETLMFSTGVPHGCVLSPLYSPYLHDCPVKHHYIITLQYSTVMTDYQQQWVCYRSEISLMALYFGVRRTASRPKSWLWISGGWGEIKSRNCIHSVNLTWNNSINLCSSLCPTISTVHPTVVTRCYALTAGYKIQCQLLVVFNAARLHLC